MESEPKSKQPETVGLSWGDISVEEIQEMMSKNFLDTARTMAEMRREGLLTVIADVDDAAQKNEGEIGPTAWEQEKHEIELEIVELEKILTTINTDTRER